MGLPHAAHRTQVAHPETGRRRVCGGGRGGVRRRPWWCAAAAVVVCGVVAAVVASGPPPVAEPGRAVAGSRPLRRPRRPRLRPRLRPRGRPGSTRSPRHPTGRPGPRPPPRNRRRHPPTMVSLGCRGDRPTRAAHRRTSGAGLAAQHPDALQPAACAHPPACHRVQRKQLGIEAPNVVEQRLDTGHHRTSGLRPLVRSGGRVFLLNDRWTPADGSCSPTTRTSGGSSPDEHFGVTPGTVRIAPNTSRERRLSLFHKAFTACDCRSPRVASKRRG